MREGVESRDRRVDDGVIENRKVVKDVCIHAI